MKTAVLHDRVKGLDSRLLLAEAGSHDRLPTYDAASCVFPIMAKLDPIPAFFARARFIGIDRFYFAPVENLC